MRRERILLTLGLWLAATAAGVAAPRPAAELPLDDKKELDRLPRCQWLGFSPDGKWLAARHAATGTAERLRVWPREGWKSHHWDIEDRNNLALSGFKACAFAADSGTLYALGGGRLYAGSLPPAGRQAAAPLIVELQGRGDLTHAAALAADGKALQVATADKGSLHLDLVSPADTRKSRSVFQARVEQLWAFAVSGEGGLCALASDVGRDPTTHILEVWETATAKRRFQHQVPRGTFTSVGFDPKGTLVATGSSDGTFRVWDAKTGRILAARDENWTVTSVDFHPTRGLLVYATTDQGGEPNCRVVDVPTGRAVASWSADSYGVTLARFSPDGKWLATVGGEGVVRVWAVKDLAGE